MRIFSHITTLQASKSGNLRGYITIISSINSLHIPAIVPIIYDECMHLQSVLVSFSLKQCFSHFLTFVNLALSKITDQLCAGVFLSFGWSDVSSWVDSGHSFSRAHYISDIIPFPLYHTWNTWCQSVQHLNLLILPFFPLICYATCYISSFPCVHIC